MKTLLKTKLYLIILASLIFPSAAKASWYTIDDNTIKYTKIAALLCVTGITLYYVIDHFIMTSEKAKKTLMNIQHYYGDLQTTNSKKIIEWARIFGNQIELSMIQPPYSIPLHRVVAILNNEVATLNKAISYLEEMDKDKAQVLIDKLNSCIGMLINCDEFSEEAKRIQPIPDHTPIIIYC